MKIPRCFRRLSSGLSIALFIALWEIAPHCGEQIGLFVAPPSVVLRTLWELFQSGELARHVGTSLFRALLGLLLASVVGIPFGFLLSGWFPTFERIVKPVLRLLGEVNPFSLFPVFMLLFGIGEISKVAMIFWVCLWPILFNTITGVMTVDPGHIKTARSMGGDQPTLIFKVILPGASPLIFNGLKIGCGTAFFMLIAAEMVGASAGLGWLVWNAQITYQIPKLFAATVAISVLGVALSGIFGFVEKKTLAWREPVIGAGDGTL
jgi:NitT/TauT family transport system permease protein